jgi:predicted transcriptional regulator
VTGRNVQPTAKNPSRLEQQVLAFLWRNGSATADAVRAGLAAERPLKDPTVRTLLRRLEEKGLVTHREEGRSYVYSVLERPRSVAVRALRQILDKFCGGSVEELVTGMVEAEVIDARELRDLARRLEDRQKGAKS